MVRDEAGALDLSGHVSAAGGEDGHYGDTAAVLWTSGTTGRSKGVMQSHNAWLRGAESGATTSGGARGRRALLLLPMHNSAAWVAIVYRALVCGLPFGLDRASWSRTSGTASASTAPPRPSPSAPCTSFSGSNPNGTTTPPTPYAWHRASRCPRRCSSRSSGGSRRADLPGLRPSRGARPRLAGRRRPAPLEPEHRGRSAAGHRRAIARRRRPRGGRGRGGEICVRPTEPSTCCSTATSTMPRRRCGLCATSGITPAISAAQRRG